MQSLNREKTGSPDVMSVNYYSVPTVFVSRLHPRETGQFFHLTPGEWQHDQASVCGRSPQGKSFSHWRERTERLVVVVKMTLRKISGELRRGEG